MSQEVEDLPDTASGSTQLASFRRRLEQLATRELPTPAALHEFSVTRFRDFWAAFLDWSELAWEGSNDVVCTSDDVRSATFFPHVRLNYAENLLRPLPGVADDAAALTAVHGDGSTDHLTRAELREEVRRTAEALRGLGLGPGDRVVAITPNNACSILLALALAALGVTLSTAAPDMGPSSLLGRFQQVRPASSSSTGGPWERSSRPRMTSSRRCSPGCRRSTSSWSSTTCPCRTPGRPVRSGSPTCSSTSQQR